MANPRIEEVDDDDFADDPEEMDLDAFDFARPQKGNLGPTRSDDDDEDDDDDDEDDDDEAAAGLSPQDMQKLMQNAQATGNMPRFSEADRERLQREQQAQSKHFQCIYPVYFDSSRSREDGRRVSKGDATPNPLARDIVDALQHIGQTKGVPLQIVFEPTKTHPKDWANPGRVKVLLKKDGKPISAKISNST
jgi:signal recognition particle subunit SRP19